ncbi:FAD-dependent oxidoreductase [Rhodospirillaceae bacterium SYSU D60014]|uniref:NAD(P)/FAD-dependent oxidoreductase n=1 Tax=Virgifigura deserti TaxID=2268457 RepID=UPI000E670C33
MTQNQAHDAQVYDAVVVGGGLIGCAVALMLADGGMSVAVLERRESLCLEASGTNAGGLMSQVLRAETVPHGMRALELWKGKTAPFLFDLDYHRLGSLALARTEAEESILDERMRLRNEAGASFRMMSGAEARLIEPQLSKDIRAAVHCEADAHVNSLETGRVFTELLGRHCVAIKARHNVSMIEPGGAGFACICPRGVVRGRRLVLATNARLQPLLAQLGHSVEITPRYNQVLVTNRLPFHLGPMLTIATGNLSIKRSAAGTAIIGGGWQGHGDLEAGTSRIDAPSVLENLRLAVSVVPALGDQDLIRCWIGVDARTPDFRPLLGPVPNCPEAYVAGCVFSGYLPGLQLGRMLGDIILGREPDLAFPPSSAWTNPDTLSLKKNL